MIRISSMRLKLSCIAITVMTPESTNDKNLKYEIETLQDEGIFVNATALNQ